jgi:hypothetical protein
VLIGQHPTNAVAREKLVPEPPDTDKTGPKGRFTEVASKVFSVPKTEIDKREKAWQRNKNIKSK